MDSTMRRLALRPWITFNDTAGGGGGTGTTTTTTTSTTDTATNGEQNGAGAGQQTQAGEHGFPPNTPVAQMTVEQQLAYWKHHARKHETRANAAADYDQVVAERDQLRQAQMSESERALQEAEERGRQAAAAELRPRLARTALTAGLTGRGMKPEDVEEELSLIDPNAFLTDKGEVDTDKVSKFLDRRAPVQAAGAGGSNTFGQGQQQQIRVSGFDAGKAEAAKRFGTKQQ